MPAIGKRLAGLLVIVAVAIPWFCLTAPAHAAVPPATVTILHGLPPSAYDIYVNGKLTLDGFQALAATDPLQLPAGVYDVAIRNVGAAADSTPILEGSITLKGGVNYTVVAHPDGGGRPALTLFVNDMVSVAAGKGRLEVRDVAQAPDLDVRIDGAPAFTGLSSLDEAARVLKAGTYSVDAVESGGSSQLITPTKLRVAEGSAAVVYIVGSENDRSLDFMIQQIDDLGSPPTTVLTGSGGLAAPGGLPGWVLVVVGLSGAVILVMTIVIARPWRRLHPAR